MVNLVIVESAAKSKTIAKYLNSSKELKSLGKFVVMASFGHVRDLVKDASGIDVDNNFKTTYVVIPDKQKVVNDLKKKAKDAEMVYIASDPDREGESIAMHVKEILNLKKYKRITFTEITQKALEQAIRNPRQIDNNLVDAQETRRVLDRLVGFKLSPLLWKKYTTQNVSTLSAGRVQSAVLHMIITKEHEIANHETSPYWTVAGNFDISVGKQRNELIDIKLYKGSTLYKEERMESVEELFKNIKNIFTILDVTNKLSRQSADMPFITSTLQQEAYSKLGMSLKRSMAVAQELYEGGYITYMRTDSYNMSEDFKVIAQKYIEESYGADFYEGGKSKGKTKVVKGAQEAHECIRITDPSLLKVPNADTQKLYDMIWKRTIAYLMKPSVYDELNIKIVDKSFSVASSLYFSSTFKKVKFNGWQIVYNVQNESYDFQDYMMKSKYSVSCKELNSKNVWTSPPQRYNDSSIVKALEAEGVGRPSTYSSIMSKLYERRYIIKTDLEGISKVTTNIVYNPNARRMAEKIKKVVGSTMVGSDKSKIIPTNIGKEVDHYLGSEFDYIVDKQFTSNMETDLDAIAQGDKTRNTVLSTFWTKFDADLKRQADQKKEKKIKLQTENTEVVVDDVAYVLRLAKYGPVIQYTDLEKKLKYIPLKGFLMLVRKQYTEVGEEDIRFLVSLPKTLPDNVKGLPVVLMYGVYGLYFKYNGKNYSCPRKLSKLFIEGEPYNEDDVAKALEYVHKEKTGEEPPSKTVKPTKATVKPTKAATTKAIKKIKR